MQSDSDISNTEKKPLSILVAEDNAINLRLITAALIRAGYTVDSAANGAIAVEKFAMHSYDAILMDIMMPVMDGITATKEIRKIESERTIPGQERVKIIAITANAFEDDRSKFFEAGMDFYMNKPVEINELHRLLSI
ncbi:MAG: response regulator [Bacteroidales bacterium]|nr:response regulator [Bacteroidales bacterium]HNW72185.1 response regulator [Bacteroidales bacterium]HPS49342.1 response regulator [Bacteroidales bacterium]